MFKKLTYKAFLARYLEKFQKTDGFNDLWFDFREQGYQDKHIESKLYVYN